MVFYGRVDVYWPDGPVESYRLNKSTIAVGRSTGNDIVLDTTAISRYHITVTFDGLQAQLNDLGSVNGTYVDGVRLTPEAPFALRGGEEIQIGDIRLIYHPPAQLELPIGSEETTQRVILSQRSFRVELDGPDMAVAPGAHVQATLKVENLGEAADRYFIEIDGLPKSWVRVDRVELELKPGEQGQAVISFKPLRRSETQPGEHHFVVRVKGRAKPGEIVDAPTVLHVLPYSGFGMALGNNRLIHDSRFKLYLHNQGNDSLSVVVHGSDREQVLGFQPAGAEIVLGPGERQTVPGVVQLRYRRLFGSDREHEFALTARSRDESGFLAAIPGIYVEQGLLPTWVPFIVLPFVALLALVVAGIALLVMGNDGGPAPLPPQITSFSVSTSPITLGEPVTLFWDVMDTRSLNVVVTHGADVRSVDLDLGTNTYPFTFTDTGHYTFLLQAHSGEDVQTSETSVDVRPQLAFTLNASGVGELVRNVQQEVQLTWDVRGAAEFDGAYRLWFDSSDRAVQLLAAPLPGSGQRSIQVVITGKQSEWLVTLYAEGGDQVTASLTQKLAIVYPVCELRAQQTVVRAGPGTDYAAIMPPQPPANAPEGTLSYSPLARDLSGSWLQVSVGVAEQRGWVPLSDFECTNFDPARLVTTSDYPPPPTAVPPVATGAPTAVPLTSPTPPLQTQTAVSSP